MNGTTLTLDNMKEEFRGLLESESREDCIRFAIEGLSSGRFDVPTLYTGILGPVLSESEVCSLADQDCIWREHVKSAITRSVIECCYPHVAREARKVTQKGASVLVLCPEKEYHELGARMVTDFFLLNGWQAQFAGANTPRAQIRAAVARMNPAIVAVSISDFYNLVEAGKAIEGLRALLEEKGWDSTRIYVGGGAFASNPDAYKALGADGLLTTYEDIRRLDLPEGSPQVDNNRKETKGGNRT